MVKACSAYNCNNRMVKGGGYSFHRFPVNNEVLLRQWVMAVRRKNFVPNQNSYLCSAHFTTDDFEDNRNGERMRSRLKSNAVPSIFNFSAEFDKPQKKALSVSPLVENTDATFANALDPTLVMHAPEASKKVTTEIVPEEVSIEKIDHSYAFGPVSKQKCGESVEDLKKKLLTLQKQLRKYEKRWENLDSQITQMKNDKVISEEAWKMLSKNFFEVRRKVRQRNLDKYCRDLLISCGFKKPRKPRIKKPTNTPPSIITISEDGSVIQLQADCNAEGEHSSSVAIEQVGQEDDVCQVESVQGGKLAKTVAKKPRRLKKTKQTEVTLAVQSIEGPSVVWEPINSEQGVVECVEQTIVPMQDNMETVQVTAWPNGTEEWTMDEHNIGAILCQMIAH